MSPTPGASAVAGKEPEMERRVLSLHARRGQDLYGFALRLGLSDEDAADTVQDAMFRVWRELCSGKELFD
ncbi:MAG: sigma factor, partial [Candidatus Limnocylindrales bacterium]